jgi:hypothetical protein
VKNKRFQRFSISSLRNLLDTANNLSVIGSNNEMNNKELQIIPVFLVFQSLRIADRD